MILNAFKITFLYKLILKSSLGKILLIKIMPKKVNTLKNLILKCSVMSYALCVMEYCLDILKVNPSCISDLRLRTSLQELTKLGSDS